MSIRKLKKQARNYLWKVLKSKWRLKSGIQVYIRSDNDWFVFHEIFTNREYDEVFQLLPSNRIHNPLVLDLGANVGYFTLRLADEFLLRGVRDFTIYSVEASLKNFKQLNERTNQPYLSNRCKPIHGLVGQKQGFSFLNTRTDHFGYQVRTGNDIGEKTDYINIDQLLNQDKRRITLLKCDIEGSEEVFLAEYENLLQVTDLAIFEFHADDCNVLRCREYLGNAGLEYYKTVKTIAKYNTSIEIFKRSVNKR